MIVEYAITNIDGEKVASVVADAGAPVSAYGALCGIEEAGRTACNFMEATLGGELLMWEEVKGGGYWTELPIGDGWLHGPGIAMPIAFRWADGFDPLG